MRFPPGREATTGLACKVAPQCVMQIVSHYQPNCSTYCNQCWPICYKPLSQRFHLTVRLSAVTTIPTHYPFCPLSKTTAFIQRAKFKKSPHVLCETWGLFVIIGLVLGKTGELFSVSRGMAYETSEPGSTSRSGVMTASEPSALRAERIMPWLTRPFLKVRGARLAMKQTCLPTSCSGS